MAKELNSDLNTDTLGFFLYNFIFCFPDAFVVLNCKHMDVLKLDMF